MNHASASFQQVFEQYVFKVANQYIESAEPSTQNKLIHLVGKVTDQSGNQNSHIVSLPSEPSEWEQVLSEPVDWRSVHYQWLDGMQRQRRERNKRYVIHLEQAVATTSHRLEQVKMSQLPEPRRSILEAYYEQTLAGYQRQLERALSLSEFHISQSS